MYYGGEFWCRKNRPLWFEPTHWADIPLPQPDPPWWLIPVLLIGVVMAFPLGIMLAEYVVLPLGQFLKGFFNV